MNKISAFGRSYTGKSAGQFQPSEKTDPETFFLPFLPKAG